MRIKWENQEQTYLRIERDDGSTHLIPAESLQDRHWQDVRERVDAGSLVIAPYQAPEQHQAQT